MNQLEESRAEIDRIDEQLAALFKKRFNAVANVLAYKKEHGLPVLDASRENQIIEKNAARLDDKKLEPYFRAWYQSMLEQSRKYQQDHMNDQEDNEHGRITD